MQRTLISSFLFAFVCHLTLPTLHVPLLRPRCCSCRLPYAIYFAQRTAIVTGAYAPTDEECVWAADGGEEEGEEEEADKGPKSGIKEIKDGEDTEGTAAEEGETEKEISGIPEFWLACLQNCPPTADVRHALPQWLTPRASYTTTLSET